MHVIYITVLNTIAIFKAKGANMVFTVLNTIAIFQAKGANMVLCILYTEKQRSKCQKNKMGARQTQNKHGSGSPKFLFRDN